MFRRRGFTLIELLIVVAIIAILAAIAVPNFLEAQMRSKISRCKADMRSIILAAECYKIDTNKYMCDNIRYNNVYMPDMMSWCLLTTPIAYMSSVPETPFKEYKTKNSNPPYTGSEPPNPGNYFEYWNGNFNSNGIYTPDAGAKETGIHWRGSSVGPDNVSDYHNTFGVSGNSLSALNIKNRSKAFINGIYDASNGTTSRGDIFVTNQGFIM